MIPMKVSHGNVANVGDFIRDTDWVFEQKMDGARALVSYRQGGFTWFANGGTELKFAAAKQHLAGIEETLAGWIEAAGLASATVVFDGEVIVETGIYHVFDLPYLMGASLATAVQINHTPYKTRRTVLWSIAGIGEHERAVLVPMAQNADQKRRLFNAVKANGGEGIVAKSLTGLYLPGVRSDDQIKLKFTHTADVVVVGRKTHPNSAQIAVLDESIDGLYLEDRMREIGSVNCNGKGLVEIGDVLEVEFLYWTGSGIVQPRIVRKRDDKTAGECGMEQLLPYSRAVVNIPE